MNDGLFKVVRTCPLLRVLTAQCAHLIHCGVTSVPLILLDSFGWAIDFHALEPCTPAPLAAVEDDFSRVFAWHSRLGQHDYGPCMTADPATPARLARDRALAALELPDWRSPRSLWR